MKYNLKERNRIITRVNKQASARKFNIEDLELFLDINTLIPHPDTFQLVKLAATVLENNPRINSIADAGTGSGIIAISLAKRFPTKQIFASDTSANALKLAKENSSINSIDNIHFVENKDTVWLSEYKGANIDFIVSNPPFIGEEEYCQEDFLLRYPEVKLEPMSAVVTCGDKYGLSPYLDIIRNSADMNTKFYLFHCNSDNVHPLVREIEKIISCDISISKDSAGLDRFLLVTR